MINYYEVLQIDENKVKMLQMHNDCVSKYTHIGVGVGSGFMNTNELQVMEHHDAINGPDSELWKAEVKKEHQRMVGSGVFEKVKRIKIPSKKKSLIQLGP